MGTLYNIHRKRTCFYVLFYIQVKHRISLMEKGFTVKKVLKYKVEVLKHWKFEQSHAYLDGRPKFITQVVSQSSSWFTVPSCLYKAFLNPPLEITPFPNSHCILLVSFKNYHLNGDSLCSNILQKQSSYQVIS